MQKNKKECGCVKHERSDVFISHILLIFKYTSSYMRIRPEEKVHKFK